MEEQERTRERKWRDKGFPWKRMISGSKSGYRRLYPDNDVHFNMNIFTPSRIWWNGDLDLTKDNLALQEVCDEQGEEMIFLSEMLGWNGAEEKSYEWLKENAHAIFTPGEKEYQVRVYDGLQGVKTEGNMTVVTGKGVAWEKVPVVEYKEPPIGDFDIE